MITTGFFSLWITNTAATALMLPIVDAVINELVKNDEEYQIKDANPSMLSNWLNRI